MIKHNPTRGARRVIPSEADETTVLDMLDQGWLDMIRPENEAGNITIVPACSAQVSMDLFSADEGATMDPAAPNNTEINVNVVMLIGNLVMNVVKGVTTPSKVLRALCRIWGIPYCAPMDVATIALAVTIACYRCGCGCLWL
eukprot:gene69-11_t